jgi:hypothetical protein
MERGDDALQNGEFIGDDKTEDGQKVHQEIIGRYEATHTAH